MDDEILTPARPRSLGGLLEESEFTSISTTAPPRRIFMTMCVWLVTTPSASACQHVHVPRRPVLQLKNIPAVLAERPHRVDGGLRP